MSLSLILWAVIAIVAGVFFSVYGFTLFRWVLFAVGFLVGFSVAMNLTSGQDDIIRIIVSLVAGSIVGVVLRSLFSISLFIAGGILGLVVSLLLSSLLSLSDSTLVSIIVLAGIGIGTFFGRFLGDMVIIVATAAAGSYAIVYGLSILFPESFGGDPALRTLVPVSSLTIIIIAALAMVSGLAQYQIWNLRQRLLRR